MKKKIYALLTTAALLVMVGCGSKIKFDSKEFEASASGFVKIKGNYNGPKDALIKVNGNEVEGLDAYISKEGSFSIPFTLKDSSNKESVEIEFVSDESTDKATVTVNK